MTIIGISAYWIMPTAPPVRIYPDFFFRKDILPLGETLITIKYNSFPSGHIYSLAIPYLFAKSENYSKWKKIFGSGLIITSWVILFTGDHYVMDIFSSYFLSLLFLTISSLIYDYYNKDIIKPPRKIIIKRLRSVLIAFLALILISIITFQYINQYVLFIQIFCIICVWPIIVIKTNTDGILNNNASINRSLISDLKDFKSSILQ